MEGTCRRLVARVAAPARRVTGVDALVHLVASGQQRVLAAEVPVFGRYPFAQGCVRPLEDARKLCLAVVSSRGGSVLSGWTWVIVLRRIVGCT
jgi:hypothetical protein